MSSFTPEQINEILEIFLQHYGHMQYVGARYVPIFGRKGEDSIEWDNSKPYEPLTIVLYQGNSYTSRQFVPAGIDITADEFWANTGNYNAQIEQYRQDIAEFENTVNNEIDNINAEIDNIKNSAIMLSVLSYNPSHSIETLGSPYLGISEDGINFNPIKPLPNSKFFINDPKVIYDDATQQFIICSTTSGTNNDIGIAFTKDFETFETAELNIGLTAYVREHYAIEPGNKWAPVITKANGKYYASVSMEIGTTPIEDEYGSERTRTPRRLFIVEIEIGNGSITPVGAVSEIDIYDLNNNQINTYFDHSIIFDNGFYYLSYKHAGYEVTNVARAANITGPYYDIAENIAHFLGAEASFICKENGQYICYMQNSTNYLSGPFNFAVVSTDMVNWHPFGYPVNTAIVNEYVRNLSPINISRKILEDINVIDANTICIECAPKTPPAMKFQRTNVPIAFINDKFVFSVFDGTTLDFTSDNADKIEFDNFWNATEIFINYKSTENTLLNRIPVVYNEQSVLLYTGNNYTANYIIDLSNEIKITATNNSRYSKTSALTTHNEGNISVSLQTIDFRNYTMIVNVNSILDTNDYVDDLLPFSIVESVLPAINNDGTVTGCIAFSRSGHDVLFLSGITKAASHATYSFVKGSDII